MPSSEGAILPFTLVGSETFGDLISVVQETFVSGGSLILFKEGFALGSNRGKSVNRQ
jgi:hypothetical protein